MFDCSDLEPPLPGRVHVYERSPTVSLAGVRARGPGAQHESPAEHSCTPALLHSCTPELLHSCTPALLHSCTPELLHSCTPALLHSCTPAPLHSWTPGLLHPCTYCTSIILHSRNGIFGVVSVVLAMIVGHSSDSGLFQCGGLGGEHTSHSTSCKNTGTTIV